MAWVELQLEKRKKNEEVQKRREEERNYRGTWMTKWSKTWDFVWCLFTKKNHFNLFVIAWNKFTPHFSRFDESYVRMTHRITISSIAVTLFPLITSFIQDVNIKRPLFDPHTYCFFCVLVTHTWQKPLLSPSPSKMFTQHSSNVINRIPLVKWATTSF